MTTKPLKYRKPKLKDLFIKSLNQVKKEYLKLCISYELNELTVKAKEAGIVLVAFETLERGFTVDVLVITVSLKACALLEFLE